MHYPASNPNLSPNANKPPKMEPNQNPILTLTLKQKFIPQTAFEYLTSQNVLTYHKMSSLC